MLPAPLRTAAGGVLRFSPACRRHGDRVTWYDTRLMLAQSPAARRTAPTPALWPGAPRDEPGLPQSVPVIGLHGCPADAHALAPLAGALFRRGIPFLAPDLLHSIPGTMPFTLRDLFPPRRPISSEDMAAGYFCHAFEPGGAGGRGAGGGRGPDPGTAPGRGSTSAGFPAADLSLAGRLLAFSDMSSSRCGAVNGSHGNGHESGHGSGHIVAMAPTATCSSTNLLHVARPDCSPGIYTGAPFAGAGPLPLCGLGPPSLDHHLQHLEDFLQQALPQASHFPVDLLVHDVSFALLGHYLARRPDFARRVRFVFCASVPGPHRAVLRPIPVRPQRRLLQLLATGQAPSLAVEGHVGQLALRRLDAGPPGAGPTGVGLSLPGPEAFPAVLAAQMAYFQGQGHTHPESLFLSLTRSSSLRRLTAIAAAAGDPPPAPHPVDAWLDSEALAADRRLGPQDPEQFRRQLLAATASEKDIRKLAYAGQALFCGGPLTGSLDWSSPPAEGLRLPTFVPLAGDLDRVNPIEEVLRPQALALPDAWPAFRLSDAGHHLLLQRPGTVAGIIATLRGEARIDTPDLGHGH
ncbi:hypothetical protein H696_04085 [Fonticula alba]|uniref:Uncharacterized protein n=1 Tax=Fonticula alba TaxID=691883 RepID=A0A058Z824_FONAL|nr:hypothetical protein H696_04085 [Fonticula alba]KCV69677.1 hypothetical protein H696_04085 [Fonticula alba]|eukprot:XP_009496242.1 hypothetical protein H696_04085 [Fonticula alba]